MGAPFLFASTIMSFAYNPRLSFQTQQIYDS